MSVAPCPPPGRKPSSSLPQVLLTPMSVIQASIPVIPNGDIVNGTGMRHVEFEGLPDVSLSSHLRCVAGTVLSIGEHGTVVVVDIIRLDRAAPVQPESWYLPSTNQWRYPIVNPKNVSLLARSNVKIDRSPTHNKHWFIEEYDERHTIIQPQRHRVFLVVHWLGVPGYDARVSFNISGYIYYDP